MAIYIDVSSAVHGKAGLGRYADSLTRALLRRDPERFALFYNRGRNTWPPEGLEWGSGGSKTTKSWDRISGIEVTPDRSFVAIDGEYAIVLPRLRLGDETYQRLIETIRRLSHLPS